MKLSLDAHSGDGVEFLAYMIPMEKLAELVAPTEVDPGNWTPT
jgi:hypothetical protein